MNKQQKQIAFLSVLLAIILAVSFYFGFAQTIFGDLTSGKQIIQPCEQTLSIGQSKDFYSCLSVYNSYADRVGDLYIKDIGSYRGMQLPAITEIMCYKDGVKEYINVKAGSQQYTNFVIASSGTGSRNPYEVSTAMTSMTSGGKIIYIRFDGCIYPSDRPANITCPSSSWTDCRRATSTNIKVWIPLSAQYEVKCLPGWTETEECWDGSVITTMQCVDYQKVSTHNKCPVAPPTGTSPPTSGGGTSPPPSGVCNPVGTPLANSHWDYTTCQWVCDTGYTMSGGVCQIIASGGGAGVAPPPATQNDTLLWLLAIILVLIVIGLAFYAFKVRK